MIKNYNKLVTIVGAGNIGSAWAALFILNGFKVTLHEKNHELHQKSKKNIKNIINLFKESYDLDSKEIISLINNIEFFYDLSKALKGTKFVIEAINENLEEKIKIFKEISLIIDKEIVIASSSSFIPISQINVKTLNKERCLNLHPGNPPYLLRFAEVVPSKDTSKKAINKTISILNSIKLKPIILKKEIDGFVFNRLQGALLREAYSLVDENIVNASDIDSIITKGLGLRWAVVGPFETIDLNTKGGIEKHNERMIPFYRKMFAGKKANFTKNSIKKVITERRKSLPLEQLDEKITWRDKKLFKLINLLK